MNVRQAPLPLATSSGWEPAPATRQPPADWTPEHAALAELVAEEIKANLARRPLKVGAHRPPSANIDTPPVGFTAHSGLVPGISSPRQP